MANKRIVNLGGSLISVSANESYAVFWDKVDAGIWESNTLFAIDLILSPGDTYIDIGAWIGPTILKASQKAGRVIAYEPDPVAASELRINLKLNNFQKVEVRELALFDEDGTMFLSAGCTGEMGSSASSLMYGDRCFEVSVKDAAKEVMDEDFQKCKLLKIDVEGAEFRLIERISKYLFNKKPSLLLSIHSRNISGNLGFTGAIKQMRALLRLTQTLSMYKYIYIETRRGWEPLSPLRRLKFIFSINRNNELLITEEPVQKKVLRKKQ